MKIEGVRREGGNEGWCTGRGKRGKERGRESEHDLEGKARDIQAEEGMRGERRMKRTHAQILWSNRGSFVARAEAVETNMQ